MKILNYLFLPIVVLVLGTAAYFLQLEPQNDMLGAGYIPVTGYSSRTTQYISASASTIPVASTKDAGGTQITLSNISSSSTVKVYLNLAAGTSQEEGVICTGVTASSWTNCTRGIDFQGAAETASTSLQKAHNAGTTIIMTNLAQFYNQYVSVDGAQMINGVKTFTSLPTIPATPVANTDAASKGYVDGVAFAGINTSTESVMGGVQLATQLEMASSTYDSNDPAVLYSRYATSSPGYAGLWAVVTQNNGKIAQAFLDLTQAYAWTGLHSWTNTSTFATTTVASSTVNNLNIVNSFTSVTSTANEVRANNYNFITGSSTSVYQTSVTAGSSYVVVFPVGFNPKRVICFLTGSGFAASGGSSSGVATQEGSSYYASYYDKNDSNPTAGSGTGSCIEMTFVRNFAGDPRDDEVKASIASWDNSTTTLSITIDRTSQAGSSYTGYLTFVAER